MDMKDIRREQLRKWFSGKPIPAQEKSYFSQLLGGTTSFGERSARRIENDYGMPERYLDGIAEESVDEAAVSGEAPPSEHPDAPSLIKAVHAVDAVLAADGITLEYQKYLDLITYVADRLRKNEAEENIGLSRLVKLLT